MKIIFNISKWLHKYVGLLLILFLMWMSISGILMNHPHLISGLSAPRFLTPPQYRVHNWNRSALTQLHFLQGDTLLAAASGKMGVFKTTDGGRSFHPMNDGFPGSPYNRKTATLFLWEGDSTLLFAGTQSGLYVCDFHRERWRRVPLPGEEHPVRKILLVKDELLVLTTSDLYRTAFPASGLTFVRQAIEQEPRLAHISLVDLFFKVHDGSAWGLPGKLLYDTVGVILFFLSVSAFYGWYFPWKRKREKQRNGGYVASGKFRRLFKWFLKYHLKLGIWSALIIFIIGFTGFFMRPPLLALLVGHDIPMSWYPAPHPHNPWEDRIQNALFDEIADEIIIEAKDGFWKAPADFGKPFRKTDPQLPVFVMGTTVWQADSAGFLAGSFNGLFSRQRYGDRVIDEISGDPAGEVSAVRPAKLMVTGMFTTPSGHRYITAHEQGLQALDTAPPRARFVMPAEYFDQYRLPLWNWLFEIHNGRFFKDLLGGIYILIVPLGALLFILITLSGVYDWLYIKLRKHL